MAIKQLVSKDLFLIHGDLSYNRLLTGKEDKERSWGKAKNKYHRIREVSYLDLIR
jgi:hypothetical protein